MSVRGLSRSLFLLCALLLTPVSALANHPGIVLPTSVAPNASFTATISTTSSFCGTGQVTMTSNRGGDVTFSPSVFSFPVHPFSQQVTVNVGNITGPLTIAATIATNCGTFVSSSRGTNIVGQGTSTLIPGTTNPVPAGLNRTIQLSLSTAASQATTFNLSASGPGASGATVPASVTVNAGFISAPINLVGGSQGDLTLSATSTSSAYSSPAPVTVKVSGTMSLAPGVFCCVLSGGTTPVTVTLVRTSPFGPIPTNVPFTTGMTITGPASAGTTLSASTLNFAAGDTTQMVTLTGGPTIGDVTLSFTNPSNNPYLSTSLTFPFRVRGSIAFANVPASLQVGQSAPITLQLSHTNISTFTLNLTLNGNAGGASLSQTAVTFNPGDTSKTVTLTAGPNASNIPLSISGFVSNAPGIYFGSIAVPASILVKNTTAPTPAGLSVTVVPPKPEGGTVDMKVTFDEVTVAGETKLTNATPIPAPSGYQVPGIPLYFALSTTASASGDAIVCASYAGATTADETGLRLMKWNGASWTDITVSVDATTNVICGNGAPLDGSTFAIFGLNSAPQVGVITGPTGIQVAGQLQQFSATVTDADATDTLTGTWVWGDGNTSPATITNGVATGEHAFAGGTFQVRLVVTDGGQHASSPDYELVADGVAPTITTISASPESLWQPNSKMHDVVVTVVANDDTGTPVCSISGVTATAQNVKQTAFNVTGPLTLQLKAFPHTTYAITVTCTDAVGRTASQKVSVSVSK